jgi:hypothetical protein
MAFEQEIEIPDRIFTLNYFVSDSLIQSNPLESYVFLFLLMATYS